MSNLIVHAGAKRVTREQVLEVKTPEASWGGKNGRHLWQPVPHHRIIEEVENSLALSGLQVVNEDHALYHDGDRYFGVMELVNGVQHEDYRLLVGIRNAHDKSFSASLACGNRVFVCDNLSFSGEVSLARKHTRHILRDLPALVSQAVGKLNDSRQLQDNRIASYKQIEVSNERAHDILVRAVDTQALTITKLPAALKEWREPRHPEFAPRTAWSLFNAVTEVYKGTSMTELPKRSTALYGLFDTACGLNLAVAV